jgi:hypothetical protein
VKTLSSRGRAVRSRSKVRQARECIHGRQRKAQRGAAQRRQTTQAVSKTRSHTGKIERGAAHSRINYEREVHTPIYAIQALCTRPRSDIAPSPMQQAAQRGRGLLGGPRTASKSLSLPHLIVRPRAVHSRTPLLPSTGRDAAAAPVARPGSLRQLEDINRIACKAAAAASGANPGPCRIAGRPRTPLRPPPGTLPALQTPNSPA